ncbi:KUP/HAK/KT family potassium transporter [uncultured Methanospirillum sp.]|uniref:KUP/HAK/KT family potassium transporter n=1 Tax=uncultured Methanospirillum sp. TaxID=262503 RepID=UPI0029C8467A|nr:KUP/HAK/KT family potassium transporter [uncultured Methanospirillum sp.]
MLQPPPLPSILKSIGLVFGDIGTSPIYTLASLYLVVQPTPAHIFGTISLIFWTLIILVSLQYAVLAMRLSSNGEGGTIVLKELLLPMVKSKYGILAVTIITFAGVSLMIGDCVITPAISILSAVEGIKLIPGWSDIEEGTLVLLAILISIGLFWFQKQGTDKVGKTFGPIMIIWFTSLAVFGIVSIIRTPEIILALSPTHALLFILQDPGIAFLSLSLIILCATGGEALFADMGHLGREPIRWAWLIVLVALTLVYLGQGAFLIRNGPVGNPFFGMIISEIAILYIPFLFLTVMATIIASQAVISGIFSVIYQAINTHLLPRLPIDYTSSELRTQIYINIVNWGLCIAVIFMLIIFGSSERLAAAYGIAVSGTMLITGVMMSTIFLYKRQIVPVILSIFVTCVDLLFFLSLLHKIPVGGYWSLVIAAIPFSIFVIFTEGQKVLYRGLNPMDNGVFIKKFEDRYIHYPKLPGTAIFFAQSMDHIPAYMTRTMFIHGIIYKENVIISVQPKEEAYGVSWHLKEIRPGLRYLSIQYGYMQVIHLLSIIRQVGIEETTVFYGMEEIVTNNIIWKIYSVIKRLSPSFVQYYRLPPDRVHGVVTRLEM